MDSRVALYFFARSGRLEESSRPVIEPLIRGSAIGERLPVILLRKSVVRREGENMIRRQTDRGSRDRYGGLWLIL